MIIWWFFFFLKHKDWVIVQDNIGSLSETKLIFVTYSYL